MNTEMSKAGQLKYELPVGYCRFNKDKSINFQINRWHSFGYWTKAEAENAGKRIKKISDWKPVLVRMGEELEAKNRLLAAAMSYRGAEFFTHPSDPDKMALYEQFVTAFYRAVDDPNLEQIDIPYQDGTLPALRLAAKESKGTIVMHGGLDSFKEEFLTGMHYIAGAGYDVIVFDGPGQGGARRNSNLYMTHEWEHAVTAVLDQFELTDVTLIGVSLGGYLALRAAAFEERVSRVVAWDVSIYDQHGSGLQGAIYRLFLRKPGLYNWIAEKSMKLSLEADWLISQWMDITNTKTPAEWIALVQDSSVSDIATEIRQDVLLMAGEKDHMIPFKEYAKNMQGLTNCRSLSGRVFTVDEHAQNHCQIGNIKLALDVILEWVGAKS